MLDWLTNVMDSLGHWGVMLLMFLENVFPPIPSEAVMPAAGFAAAQGRLSFAGVVIAGTIGSVLGSLPLYWLGYTLGKRRLKSLADRYGKWLTVSGDDIENATGWFDRYGRRTVFFCRLVPGIRSLISIPAGICSMSLLPFLAWSTAGSFLWTLILAYLGRLLGEHYDRVETYVGPVSYVVFGGLAVWLVVWVVRRKRLAAAATA